MLRALGEDDTLKTVYAALLCFALVAGTTVRVDAASMTQRDRDRLVAHLQMTGSWLPEEVAHLSQAQVEFRPAPDKWTIAEVVEHLVLAEPGYWKLLQNGVRQPHMPAFKSKATDADVLWYGIDRTHRQKTSSDEDSRGQHIQISEALGKWTEFHNMMLQYAKTTTDDLRAHDVREWNVDAYQWFLEISTHAQRHILQIREIKADPGFPRSPDQQ